VGGQGRIGLSLDGVRQAFATDEHDWIEVMGIGTQAATFGRGQLNGRHHRIIRAT
jgi:hypothetical protein